MRIGIDASRSIESIQKTGVEKISDEFLYALNNELSKSDSTTDVQYYTPQKIDWLPIEQQQIITLPRLWTTVRLSIELLLHKPDVFFSPVHELPFFCPSKTYRLIHDVAFLKNPENYSWFQNWYLRFGLERSIRLCTKIFVATEAVKEDLIELTNIDSEKIVVTGFGYERMYKVSSIKHHRAKKNQILYIGRIEEKKNLVNLIKAFELFSKNNSDYTLVLAGKDGYGADLIHKQITHLRQTTYGQDRGYGGQVKSKSQIQLLGYISDEKKWELLAESAVLCLISKAEGFGIPLLEGFDAGIPVVVADIPVLREVGGEACVYVDPDDVYDIAKGLTVAIQENNTHIITKGQDRLQLFDWEKVVNKIVAEITSE